MSGDSPDGWKQLLGAMKALSLPSQLCLQCGSNYRNLEKCRVSVGKHFSWQVPADSWGPSGLPSPPSHTSHPKSIPQQGCISFPKVPVPAQGSSSLSR